MSALALIRRRSCLAAALLAGASGMACAQIYASTTESDGAAVVLSNFASDVTPHVLVAAPAVHELTAIAPPAAAAAPTSSLSRPLAVRKAPAEISAMIADVARQVNLSPALIHAVIAQESNFDPFAVSAKGAKGLMQLMPDTASRFGARHPFDPRDNILAGALYLRWLAGLFDNRLDLVLAAYNAGEQTVIRAGRQVPDYAETRNYVARILGRVSCRGIATCSTVGPA
jgi:soluble lytic murein transglycosylase-like protein